MKTVILTLVGLLLSLSAVAASEDCRFSDQNLDSETSQMLQSKGYEIVQRGSQNALFLETTLNEGRTNSPYVNYIIESVQVRTRINNLTYDHSEKIEKITQCVATERFNFPYSLLHRSCDKVDFTSRLIRKAIKSLPNCVK